MSREAVIQFVNQAEEDDDLRHALREVQGLEGVADLARKRGFEFGVEELRPVLGMLRFLVDASRNEELRDALRNAADPAAIVELASARGYEFSTDELEYVSFPDNSELTDSELEGVAGGVDIKPQTGLRVQLQQSRNKTSTGQSFGEIAASGLSRTADAALSAGGIAAPFIPGGSVLSAALSG